jgi:hypothetical protein
MPKLSPGMGGVSAMTVGADVIKSLDNLGAGLLTPWPHFSQELNKTQRILAIMKSRVEIENQLSRRELESVVRKVWDDLTLDTINASVAGMPWRLIEVVRNKRRTEKYVSQHSLQFEYFFCGHVIEAYRTKVHGRYETPKFSRLSVQRIMDIPYFAGTSLARSDVFVLSRFSTNRAVPRFS